MLGSSAIVEAINLGKIVIDPYIEKHLGPNSYDLRLGDWYVRQKNSELTIGEFVTLPDYYEGMDAEKISEFIAFNGGVKLDDPINGYRIWESPRQAIGGTIWLRPGELILGHTMERVGCYGDITGEMSSRSSMMRHGISVCIDAGLGDVGFDSKWTMEISNHTKYLIGLSVGMRIAQIKFHRVEGPGINYQEKGGTYGRGEWTPQDMIPRSSLF